MLLANKFYMKDLWEAAYILEIKSSKIEKSDFSIISSILYL